MSDHDTTALIHHPYRPPEGFEAPQVGVFKASTILFPSMAAVRQRDWQNKSGYTYGLHGTPTTFTLEERIAHLEHGRHTLLTPSGLAAISLTNLALLNHGDEVLLPYNVYGPSRSQARHLLSRYGIGHGFYDAMDVDSLARAITPATKLIWIEAPGSVTMEFPDVRALLRAAAARGVRTALDNTWGAGIAFNAFDLGDGLGADVVVQALTKYPSGGGDVLMGAVTTVDESLHRRIKAADRDIGMGVGGNDAEAVLRSLPSIALRYHAQDRTARALATWLRDRPEISQVLHPALEGAPGHVHWRDTCSAAAGLFSVVFDARFGADQVDAFVDALRLFRIGYSWAGAISLAVAYDLSGMRDPAPWAGGLVRFSIGLEAEADLRDDLSQALGVLASG